MKVTLRHQQSGLIRKVKVGFSWTTLFFGGLPPLFRGDLKWFVIMWLLIIPTLGISYLVFPFTYNRIYIKGLLEKGYVPADDSASALLKAVGYIA